MSGVAGIVRGMELTTVLLLVVAAYLMVRAIQTGGTRWVVLVGVVLILTHLA